MKRRAFVKTLVAAPAVPALLSEAKAQAPEAAGLTFAPADAAGDGVLRFLDARQIQTLRRLCDLLEPAVYSNAPSANAARVPEFLDFYLQACPQARQQLYRDGLGLLETQSQTRFGLAFALTNETQAAELLESLRQPWTYEPPSRLAEFLRDARPVVRSATRNSYEWERVGRGESGNYWKPVE
jgi:hypothetical protein